MNFGYVTENGVNSNQNSFQIALFCGIATESKRDKRDHLSLLVSFLSLLKKL